MAGDELGEETDPVVDATGVKACGGAANQRWYLPAATAPPIPPTESDLGAALFRK